MRYLLFLLALTGCTTTSYEPALRGCRNFPSVEGSTPESRAEDTHVAARAIETCWNTYGKCVRKIRRVSAHNYHVVCGGLPE